MGADGVEQVAFGDEHTGEEDQQQDLGELGGLNTEARQADPDLGPVCLREAGRQQGGDGQQDQTGEATDVVVARQHPVVLQIHHSRGESGDADQRPEHLLFGTRRVGGHAGDEIEAVDEHQAQTVEQCDHRKQQRIGVRGEVPDRQMGTDEQREEREGVTQ